MQNPIQNYGGGRMIRDRYSATTPLSLMFTNSYSRCLHISLSQVLLFARDLLVVCLLSLLASRTRASAIAATRTRPSLTA